MSFELSFGTPAAPGAPALPMNDYDSLVHPQDRERVQQEVRDGLARRSGHRVEYRVVWPDGKAGEWQKLSGDQFYVLKRDQIAVAWKPN